LDHWTSPFPVPQRCRELLERLGLEQLQDPPPQAACLRLYDAPDQVLMAAAEAGIKLSTNEIVEGYRQLGKAIPASHLMSCWRFMAIPEAVLLQWLREAQPLGDLLPAGFKASEPRPSSLGAVLALQLLDSQPILRESYLDLELRSELATTAADSCCISRYREQCDSGILLQTWLSLEEELRSKDQQLASSQAEVRHLHKQIQDITDSLTKLQQQLLVHQEETQLSSLQVQQLQEELQRTYHSSQMKDIRIKELEAITNELGADKEKAVRRLNRTQLLLSQATQIISMLRSRKGFKTRSLLAPPALLPAKRD
jgi:hypothetical protein